MTELPYHT
jgi:hypothetical protein